MTGDSPLASIVISTFNRTDALLETLAALGHQSLSPGQYEVIVVDDGSTDGTSEGVDALHVPYDLITVRHQSNRGVSAGRNSGLRRARGRYVIMISDDVLVPPTFISDHVQTLERHPGAWVVGGFRQLESLRTTPFGRYLDNLESSFTDARKQRELTPGIWELAWPTARNLSLPAADLTRTGLFDEQFRTTCEDLDLAERARAAGIRFIYNEAIDCLHNDAAAEIGRYCGFQERGAYDTARYVAKNPKLHGEAPIVSVNGPIRRGDAPSLVLRKVAKRALCPRAVEGLVIRMIKASERAGLPDRALHRAYRTAIGIAIFRGWRRGLRDLGGTFGSTSLA